jgi:hypothetical protein
MHLFLLLNFAYMLLIVIGLESMYVEVDNLHDLLLRLDFTLSDVLSQNIL